MKKTFSLLFPFLLTALSLVSSERAHLELIVKHEVNQTVKPGDHIIYNLVLKQKPVSQLDAVDINVRIMLPSAVKFIQSSVIGSLASPTTSTSQARY